MLKNVRFVMLTGAVMAVYFAPIIIEASPLVQKESVQKVVKKKKCPCGKKKVAS